MKTESEFMNEVMEKLNRATTDIHCLVTDKKELEGKAEDKKYYSAQYISETLYPAINEKRYAIQQKQEQNSEPETDEGRQKREPSHILALFHCRYDQRPDRCGDHHACRKTAQSPFHCAG